MSNYVLVRSTPLGNGHRAMVAMPGNHKSYTSSLDRARKFDTEEAAKACACGNERPVPVRNLT